MTSMEVMQEMLAKMSKIMPTPVHRQIYKEKEEKWHHSKKSSQGYVDCIHPS